MKRALLVALCVVLLLLLPLGIWTFCASSDLAGLPAAIEKGTGEEQVAVLETAESGDFLAALFSAGDERQRVALFRKNLFGRYEFFGDGSGSEAVHTYSYSERGERTLVAVYGAWPEGAERYSFELGGRRFEGARKGELLLDLYLEEGVDSFAGNLTLYGVDGAEL